MNCRVCSTECKKFLDLGWQPIANNFLTHEQLANEFFYHLKVYFCPVCLTVQIGECPDSSQVFNKDYAFFTGTSEKMREHFAHLADLIKESYMPENGCIMEIGSNDGTFLEHFKDNVHLGFDPSDSVNKVAMTKGVRVYPYPFEDFGDASTAWPKTDVFVSCNAFAHIPDRKGVLSGIKKMLAPNGVWIDEEPYMGNIINNLEYDQFYNEHVFYTSIASMQKTLAMFDLEIKDFEFIWTHCGSIRYFVGHRNPGLRQKVSDAIKNEGLDNFEIFEAFGKKVKGQIDRFKKRLFAMEGPLVGYAASAKSTTLLNCCKIGPDIIEKIYDTTPAKQGKLSPGMHIPIVSYDQFKKDNPSDVVLFAWNHFKEVMAKEAGVERNWIIPNGSL